MSNNQVCSNCVMDNSDPKITFDHQGICDHCHGFFRDVLPNWHPNIYGKSIFREQVKKIKKVGKGKPYNCIIGLSGGLDSSYLLHLAVKEFDLKPLVFHVDGGWNTDIAVSNIQSLVDKLDLDLFTEVIDWQDMRDFQLALFKSGTPYIDLAQDHAFFATMYHYARKHDIKYILNGGNYATECIRNPKDWHYYGTDMSFIKDLRKKYTSTEMKHYPWSGILYHKVYLRYLKGIKVVKPLNTLPYKREEAIDTLVNEYGWKPYPQKHFESRFTKFAEGYWLPSRFGYDVRKVQFSSLIVTNQMSREEAIQILKMPSYNHDDIDSEFEYIANKLEITTNELREYHRMEKKSFRDYKNEEWLFDLGAKAMKMLGLETAIKR